MSEPEQPEASAADEDVGSSSTPPNDPGATASTDARDKANAHDNGDNDLQQFDDVGDGDNGDHGDHVVDEFGPPFVPKTFGGAFVWAKGERFVSTVLRIKEGKSVPVATTNRQDMHVMLTGGRAVLEIDDGTDVDRIELMPAGPLHIDPAHRYRLIAMTEVEIFTVYTLL